MTQRTDDTRYQPLLYPFQHPLPRYLYLHSPTLSHTLRIRSVSLCNVSLMVKCYSTPPHLCSHHHNCNSIVWYLKISISRYPLNSHYLPTYTVWANMCVSICACKPMVLWIACIRCGLWTRLIRSIKMYTDHIHFTWRCAMARRMVSVIPLALSLSLAFSLSLSLSVSLSSLSLLSLSLSLALCLSYFTGCVL